MSTIKFPFIEACFGRPVPFTPVWIMRQAGRYLPEYRAIRETTSFWGLCETPELAAEVTLQPIDRLGVDAAILFSDILVPVKASGLNVEFIEGKGPVLPVPLRSLEDVQKLHIPEPLEEMAFVPEAIKLVLERLNNRVPLIGFSGAPFTLASYMIEGGGSKTHHLVKSFMYNEPKAWDALMSLLVETVIKYLNAQIDAGVHCVQLFDSWAGVLSPSDYEKYALPYTKRVFAGLKREGIPVIHFAVDSAMLLHLMKDAGSDVVGLDWRTPLDWGRNVLGDDIAVQGNFDPCRLLASPESIRSGVQEILDKNDGRPGHVFNLGHGIMPMVDPDHAKIFVDAVHEFSEE
jgi:uroporphyrinogen decarboxylase